MVLKTGGAGETANVRNTLADPTHREDKKSVAKLDTGAARRAAAKVRAMWSPPRASVEVSGVLSDRSFGTRGRPQPSEGGAAANRQKQSKKETRVHQTKNDRGRVEAYDQETGQKNKLLLDAEPAPPADFHALPNFTADWICCDVSGDWEEYLYILGVPEMERKMSKARNFGKGHEEQHITHARDKQSILIRNPLKTMSYTTGGDANADASRKVDQPEPQMMVINGKPHSLKYAVANQGMSEGAATLAWEGKSLVMRGSFQLNGVEEKYMIKRSLVDEQHMIVELFCKHVVASRTFIWRSEYIY